MSEYQHYNFLAIDRALTSADMAELRALSTRADITATSFTNDYQWGQFKGDPDAMMSRYFDAYCYVSNWGVREIQFRFPKREFDRALVEPYLVERWIEWHGDVDFGILRIVADDEEGQWELVRDVEEWLPGLVPLRADLLAGDLRSLYIAWLAVGFHGGFDDESTLEPPVPPGLAEPSPALAMLAELLMLDGSWIAAGARGGLAGGPPRVEPPAEALSAWIANLDRPEADRLLVRVAEGDSSVGLELRRRFREAQAPTFARPMVNINRRSVQALEAIADDIASEQVRNTEIWAAKARAQELDGLAAREGQAWKDVEGVFLLTVPPAARAAPFAEKAKLLRDLRDLAAREGRSAAFEARVLALRSRYAQKKAFWARYNGTSRW
jgi:hypothetical protein